MQICLRISATSHLRSSLTEEASPNPSPPSHSEGSEMLALEVSVDSPSSLCAPELQASQSLLVFITYINYVYEYFACMYVSAAHGLLEPKIDKRGTGVKGACDYPVGDKNHETEVGGWAARAPNRSAISPNSQPHHPGPS